MPYETIPSVFDPAKQRDTAVDQITYILSQDGPRRTLREPDPDQVTTDPVAFRKSLQRVLSREVLLRLV
jgi:hypothetical protein